MTDEYLLVGWDEIHKLFCDKDGKPTISFSTLMRRFAPEMKSTGAVLKFHVGRGKNPTIRAWPSQVKRYITMKQQKGELADKKYKK